MLVEMLEQWRDGSILTLKMVPSSGVPRVILLEYETMFKTLPRIKVRNLSIEYLTNLVLGWYGIILYQVPTLGTKKHINRVLIHYLLFFFYLFIFLDVMVILRFKDLGIVK